MADKNYSKEELAKRARFRRGMESLATFGLLIVAVAMVAPFGGLTSTGWMTTFKWLYAAGALTYFGARIAGSLGKDESFRIRRLRRMEVFAGLAFCFASFFWFYNTRNFDGMPTFHMFQDTIIFTLTGALIQIVASWLLSSALNKERKQKEDSKKL